MRPQRRRRPTLEPLESKALLSVASSSLVEVVDRILDLKQARSGK